jgi:DNA-binding response OmpR family regulator
MKRILVIDDDSMIRQLCKAYFTAKGHTVEVSENGKKGMARFSKEDFDLVITDLMMDNGHGFEVIDFIKLTDKGARTPVILLSADKDQADLESYERRRFQDDTLSKPFDMPVLEAKVNSLFEEFADH